MSIAIEILEEAISAMQDRAENYVAPEIIFSEIAADWSDIFGVDLTASQVCEAMAALKKRRLQHNPKHRDSVVDMVAYAALAFALQEDIEPEQKGAIEPLECKIEKEDLGAQASEALELVKPDRIEKILAAQPKRYTVGGIVTSNKEL